MRWAYDELHYLNILKIIKLCKVYSRYENVWDTTEAVF